MLPEYAYRRVWRKCAIAAMASVLAACGQKRDAPCDHMPHVQHIGRGGRAQITNLVIIACDSEFFVLCVIEGWIQYQ